MPDRRGPLKCVAALLLTLTYAGCSAGNDDPGGFGREAKGVAPSRAEICPGPTELAGAAVVLGCATLADGRAVGAFAYARGSKTGASGDCVEIYVEGQRTTRGCIIVPSRRRPPPESRLIPEALYQSASDSPLEAYGAAKSDVERVELTFMTGDATESVDAALIAAEDSEVLGQLGVRKPFRVFVAFLPPGSDRISATATGADGRVLATTDAFPEPPVFTLGAPPRGWAADMP